MRSRTGAIAKLMFGDLLGSVVVFPVWWYTVGLQDLVSWAGRSLRYSVQKYGFAIWVRNFFVPMYGQYDIAGRAISLLMRFVVLIGRAVALFVEVLADLFVIAMWILLPPAVVLLLLANLAGGLLTPSL